MALVSLILSVVALLLAALHYTFPALILVAIVLVLIAGGPYVNRRV